MSKWNYLCIAWIFVNNIQTIDVITKVWKVLGQEYSMVTDMCFGFPD